MDFDTRLRRLGVASSLHVENALPHGFSGLVFVSKHARRAVETGTRFLESSCFTAARESNNNDDGSSYYERPVVPSLPYYDPSAPVPLSPDRPRQQYAK